MYGLKKGIRAGLHRISLSNSSKIISNNTHISRPAAKRHFLSPSFGSASIRPFAAGLRRLKQLENAGSTHPAADTHGNHTVLQLPLGHFT